MKTRIVRWLGELLKTLDKREASIGAHNLHRTGGFHLVVRALLDKVSAAEKPARRRREQGKAYRRQALGRR
jgi:hypothetical protein